MAVPEPSRDEAPHEHYSVTTHKSHCWIWHYGNNQDGQWEPMPFSTSIEAAMQVIEKMWQTGWQVELTNNYKLNTAITENSCVWWVRFINNENDMDNWSDEADTLPEAICRAALKAVTNSHS